MKDISRILRSANQPNINSSSESWYMCSLFLSCFIDDTTVTWLDTYPRLLPHIHEILDLVKGRGGNEMTRT